MKGEGGMPGAEGLKGEPGTPVSHVKNDISYNLYLNVNKLQSINEFIIIFRV